MTREDAYNRIDAIIAKYEIDDEYVTITNPKDYDALRIARKTLEQESKWISISEKLPEEHEWMGTKRFGTTISDEIYVTLETPDGERFTKHLSFQNGELSQTDQERMNVWFKGAVPIAWMPLPEPYEPQERSE